MPMAMGTGAVIGAGEKRHRRAGHYTSVMPALVADIHALLGCETKDVDGRDVVREDGAARLMPGHDARRAFANLCSAQSIVGQKRCGGASRQKNFKSKNISISDACAAVANQFVDRA
jgi:hypothetical protein